MARYFIQVKQNHTVLQEHNTLCDEFNIITTVEILRYMLRGLDLILEVYTFDSLMDDETIKWKETIKL